MNTKTPISVPEDAILPSLQMICDEFDDLFWEYYPYIHPDSLPLLGCRIFYPGCDLQDRMLYLVSNDRISDFPVDQYPYITGSDVDGTAPHISCLNRPIEEILDVVLNIFMRYRDFEATLNSILNNDGTLQELCMTGSLFFRNPLYIHDNMFSIIALPRRIKGMLEFDINKDTGEMHVPLSLINDFKFDDEYKATLNLHSAAIWGHEHFPHPIRSLFVNLWEGDYYYGRLLINEIESSLKPGQFRLAEQFADYCKKMIRRDNQRARHDYKDHQETLHALYAGQSVHESDLHAMLSTLGWEANHRFLCLQLMSQDSRISVRSDSALRSTLASIFKDSVQFFHNDSLCLLFNLNTSMITAADILPILAPFVRDNYLYAGLSLPVRLDTEMRYGALQTDYALKRIRRSGSTRWIISFSECMLEYVLEHVQTEIPHSMLIPPALRQLLAEDREKGTQYYDTLKAYLLCERSIPRTSNLLFVHRTTLLYRLEKLQAKLGMDLEDPNIRLQLLLCFRYVDQLSPLDQLFNPD